MAVVVSYTDRNNVSILCQSVTDSINECMSVFISNVYNPIRKMVIYIYEKLREMVRKLILSLKQTLIDFEITLSKIQYQTYTNINAIRGPPQILKKIYKIIEVFPAFGLVFFTYITIPWLDFSRNRFLFIISAFSALHFYF